MMGRVQLPLISVSELWPFDCVFMLICVINILVHPITHSVFMKTSCNELCPLDYCKKNLVSTITQYRLHISS